MALLQKQKGTTLLELMLVVSLISLLTMLAFIQKASEMEDKRAQMLGNYLFTYANAARHYLAANPDVPATTGIQGTNWLKNGADCGGTGNYTQWGTTAYLPCEFLEGTTSEPLFGDISLQTDIVKIPGGQTQIVTTTSPLTIGGTRRPDLAGLAAVAAAAGTYASSDGVIMSTFGSFKSNINTAEITLIVNNGVDGDLWIRQDDPQFKKAAYFKETLPASEREFRNIARITSKIGEALRLGRPGGAVSGDTVVVDASQSVLGGIAVSGAATLNSNVSIGGHISSVQNITSSGTVTGNSMRSSRYYDASGNTYYLAPSGTSRLGTINANVLSAPTITATTRLDANEVRLSRNRTANGTCVDGEVAKTSDGVLMTCVNQKFVITASWVNGTVTPGSSCTPGSFAFDNSNNLHVCR